MRPRPLCPAPWLLLAALALLTALPRAEQPPAVQAGFTLGHVKAYPFPAELTAAATGEA